MNYCYHKSSKLSLFTFICILLVIKCYFIAGSLGQEANILPDQVCSSVEDHTCSSNDASSLSKEEEEQQQQQQQQQQLDETLVVPTLHDDDNNDDDDDDDYDDLDNDTGLLVNVEVEEEGVEKYNNDEFDDDDNDDDDDYDDYDDDESNIDDDDLCKDKHELCEEWSHVGECDANPNYMLKSCERSCKVCKPTNRYGLKQSLNENLSEYNDLVALQEKMDTYMEEEIISNPELKYLAPRCKNRHVECTYWAHLGECDANPQYMLTNCAPVCNTCHLLDFKRRCPIGPDVVDAMKQGDLNKMFERIVNHEILLNSTSIIKGGSLEQGDQAVDNTEEMKYDVTILSRPSFPEGVNEENADYQIGPWVITLDNFIKSEECDKLIELGGNSGYERSEDVGKELFDGSFDSVQSKSRTSSNAWCQDECYEHPVAKAVMDRIELVTGIPETNSENLQLLKYNVGQFYRTHHDYIENQEEFPAGPRLLTAFLYLNDVEGGGGTNFPGLKLTVQPKKGRMLLWPSVLDQSPNKKDFRTSHQALTVEKGIKYAANAWIHMRDFKGPNEIGCT